MIASATTPSATGFPATTAHRSRSARSRQRRRRERGFESGRVGRPTEPARSKKLCPPPVTPNRLGSWVIAMVRPAPALKPTRMLSLISFTSALNRNSQAIRQSSCDGEGGEAGDLGVTLRVALRHCPHRSGDHQRDGGGRPDRQLTRGSEQGVTQPAQQIAVDADLRRQAGKSGVSKRNRDRVGRERYRRRRYRRVTSPGGIPSANAPAETTCAMLTFDHLDPPCSPTPANDVVCNIGNDRRTPLMQINIELSARIAAAGTTAYAPASASRTSTRSPSGLLT